MKRQLITLDQEFLIVCDNTFCDYKIDNPDRNPYADISHYVNVPCPKCGENLLTEEDHLQSLKLLKVASWLNKWFSWLTIFSSKRTKPVSASIHCHNGIKIQKEEGRL